MLKHKNFLFVGVGGQGVLTASDIAAQVGIDLGLDAKKSEVHGFAQRGGVVESHIRWAPTVGSPTCEKGTVDLLLAFELLEAVRWLDWLSPSGDVIVNQQQIMPMSVNLGQTNYPESESLLAVIRERANRLITVKALPLAKQAGSVRTINTVLLATLSTLLETAPRIWEQAILQRVPENYAEMNKLAFKLGREAAVNNK